MSDFIPYPSTGQLKDMVKEVTYDSNRKNFGERPTIEFTGTVKVHGTNAAYCEDGYGSCWFQSRKRILSLEKDNNGFYVWGSNRGVEFGELADEIRLCNDIERRPEDTLAIYGEFCGGSIQHGVALTGLPKMFILFGAKLVSEIKGETVEKWLDIEAVDVTLSHAHIYNTYSYFDVYKKTIDLNNPAEVVNELIDLTMGVEEECPVGRYFGRVKGEDCTVGEGIVWTGKVGDKTYRFKVKGEKHSTSKVKKLASVDPEKVKGIAAFIEYAVTENRLKQALQEVFEGGPPSMRRTGEFLKWVCGDIVKEEEDTLVASMLTMKEVGKPITTKAVKWFKEQVALV